MCIDTEYQYEQEGSPAVSCAYVCRQLRAGVTVLVEVMDVYTIWSFEWATTSNVKSPFVRCMRKYGCAVVIAALRSMANRYTCE